jgi:predicted membrane protein
MVDKHKRVISAVVLVILILFFVLSGGIIFKIGVLGITGIALYEYIKVYDCTNSKAITWVLAAGFAADIFILYFNSSEYILPIIYLIVLCSMAVPIFTKKYNVNKLVYFEHGKDIKAAIFREKQIKAGSRRDKVDLINSFNKDWNDLFYDL